MASLLPPLSHTVAATKRRQRNLWLRTTPNGATLAATLVMASVSQKIESRYSELYCLKREPKVAEVCRNPLFPRLSGLVSTGNPLLSPATVDP